MEKEIYYTAFKDNGAEGGYILKDEYNTYLDAKHALESDLEMINKEYAIISFINGEYQVEYAPYDHDLAMEDYMIYEDSCKELGKRLLQNYYTGQRKSKDIVNEFIDELREEKKLRRVLNFFHHD